MAPKPDEPEVNDDVGANVETVRPMLSNSSMDWLVTSNMKNILIAPLMRGAEVMVIRLDNDVNTDDIGITVDADLLVLLMLYE